MGGDQRRLDQELEPRAGGNRGGGSPLLLQGAGIDRLRQRPAESELKPLFKQLQGQAHLEECPRRPPCRLIPQKLQRQAALEYHRRALPALQQVMQTLVPPEGEPSALPPRSRPAGLRPQIRCCSSISGNCSAAAMDSLKTPKGTPESLPLGRTWSACRPATRRA